MRITRRQFSQCATATAGLGFPWLTLAQLPAQSLRPEINADVVIIGGSLGGCAAAIAALRNGQHVVMTELTDWIGGQLTSQAVPPDEHRWIESHGANASYRELRQRIRAYYRQHYPLTDAARGTERLNPGNGSVSRLCHEPRVAKSVLENWLAPYASSRQLVLLTKHQPISAEVNQDRVGAVTVRSLQTGQQHVLTGDYFVDATELGDLLPLTKTDFVTGSESRAETHEMHAADKADPDNQQAFTMCFPVDFVAGQEHTIEKPAEYEFWRDFVPSLSPPWPGKLLDFTYTHPRSGQPKTLGFNPAGGRTGGVINLWTYRRLADAKNFTPGSYTGDVSLINWPQNDYMLGNLVGVTDQERDTHIQRATQLSLSLLYWLQTEAPRMDGGPGFPELRLRGDLVGTENGVAKYPYVRESRRIRGLFKITEEHVGHAQRAMITGESGDALKAATFTDSVGVGSYGIDLHPSASGDNYIDFASLPFQIPLGALIPQQTMNLLPACKNISTTHITSGCYRLHPVEWGIGEAVGCLASYAIKNQQLPKAIWESKEHVTDFQRFIRKQGVEIAWP